MRHRGSALIVAMWVLVALAGLVLVMSYSVRIEAAAVANRMAGSQVEAALRGAEQFLISAVTSEIADPGALDDISFEQRQIGSALVWVIRPDVDDSAVYDYGLIDESARVDLNTATSAMLLKLPGITNDVVDAIVDWRDADSTVSAQGAENEYYLGLSDPYRAKNGQFESVDELLLVKRITPEVLYGMDRNRNGILDDRETQAGGLATQVNSGQDSSRGLAPFVTAWAGRATSSSSSGSSQNIVDVNAANTSRLRSLLVSALSESRADQIIPLTISGRPFANVFDFRFRAQLTQEEFTTLYPRLDARPAGNAQTPAKINVNRAGREVLLCLPRLEENDVEAIITRRQNTQSDATNLAWLADVLSREKAIAVGSLVTGTSKCFSGEIAAVSEDGRAFRRSRIIIDASGAAPRIIYRKDTTTAGWPLPPEIRARLRSGERFDDTIQSSSRGVPAS